MKKTLFTLLIGIFSSCVALAAKQNPVPVPINESGLKTVTAKPWFTVSPDSHILEGAILDADGNLLFCDVTERKVMRLAPDKKISTVVEVPELSPGGLAVYKDGRIFMAAISPEMDRGAILAFSPATEKIETIVPVEAGFMPNDLAPDKNGGFYFSDFRGNATNPIGGIYYLDPDLKTVTPVIPHMAQANGVALSPDGKTLWATEFAKNRLHQTELQNPVKISPVGSHIPYHFTGPAPDSMRTDKNGDVYVAIYGQGRVLVFNQNGIPVGQILLPGRELGRNLLSTSLTVRPDGRAYIVTSDGTGKEGAQIFEAESLGQ